MFRFALSHYPKLTVGPYEFYIIKDRQNYADILRFNEQEEITMMPNKKVYVSKKGRYVRLNYAKDLYIRGYLQEAVINEINFNTKIKWQWN